MLKYKQNRKLTTFICFNCGKEDSKPTSEYNRNLAKGRRNFCSRSCSVKISNSSKTNFSTLYDISEHSGNKRDLYTPFRYTYRNCKKRFKDFDLSIEDLMDQWSLQKGVCPYSKLPLGLPEYKKKVHFSTRASLDRIDSSKGYIKGNIQFVSTLINLLKSNLSHQDTLDFISKVVKNYCSCHQEDQTISSPDLGAGR